MIFAEIHWLSPNFQLYSRFKKNPQWIQYSYCEPRILMYTKFSWKNKNEGEIIRFFKIIDYMWQHLYKNINNLYINRYFRYKITYFLKNLKCSVFIIFTNNGCVQKNFHYLIWKLPFLNIIWWAKYCKILPYRAPLPAPLGKNPQWLRSFFLHRRISIVL